jgi:hypothetical protein
MGLLMLGFHDTLIQQPHFRFDGGDFARERIITLVQRHVLRQQYQLLTLAVPFPLKVLRVLMVFLSLALFMGHKPLSNYLKRPNLADSCP